jgi:SAM-dependent methyltransferase
VGRAGSVPLPFCGHVREAGELRRRGATATCPACGSFWDLDSLARDVVYDADYCASRLHTEGRTGELKFRSLARWLDALGIDLAGRVVCEVGFGGGYVLRGVARRGGVPSGIEANPAALASARALGVPAEHLHAADRLPERLEPAVDLWLFLDSFEHVPDPAQLLAFMARSSRPAALALVVAPDAGSPSARWLGSAWPHRLPDHTFHWSRRGIVELWARHGFELRRSFAPRKLVSPAMLAAHALLMLGVGDAGAKRALRWLAPLQRVALPFNVGEFGLVFGRAQRGDA